MAQDVYEILVRLNTQGAESGLRSLDAQVKNVTRSKDGMTRAAGGMSGALGGVVRALGPLAAIFSAGLLAKNVFSAAREFESLRGQLGIVTGDADSAAAAMESLTAFVSNTPFTIDQATQAFIRLGQFGIQPTDRLFNALGNVASGLGTDIENMADMVTRAQRGMFGRLGMLGIQMERDGEQIVATYQGVTQRIGSDTESIVNYFTELGEGVFAGAMEDNVNTIDGAFARARTSFVSFADSVGQSGLNEGIVSVANAFLEASEGAGNLGEILGRGLNVALTAVAETITFVSNTVVPVLIKVFNDARAAIMQAYNAISNNERIQQALTWIIDTSRNVVNSLLGIWNFLGQSILKVFTDVFNLILRGYNNIVERASGIARFFNEDFGNFLSNATVQLAGETRTWAEIIEDSFGRDYISEFVDLAITGFERVSEVVAEYVDDARAAAAVGGVVAQSLDSISIASLATSEALDEVGEAAAKSAESVAQIVQQLEFELSLLGLTNRERQVRLNLQRAERSAGRELTEAEIEDIRRATEAIEDKREVLREAEQAQRDYERAVEETNRRIANSIESLGQAFGRWASGTKEAIASVIIELIRLAMIGTNNFGFGGNRAAAGLFDGFLGGLSSGFGGFRQFGGPMAPNKEFIVGETGPELIRLRVPGTAVPIDRNEYLEKGANYNIVLENTFNIMGTGEYLTTGDLPIISEEISRVTNQTLVDELRFGGVNNYAGRRR